MVITNKPQTIKTEDVEKIKARLSRRDRNIFWLSCETGLRIGDVLNLKAYYVGKIMYVQELKTGKWRSVEISDELLHELTKYKPDLKDRHKWLFGSPRSPDKHLHRTTYHRHLKNVCNELKINFSAHSARKYYAQELFKRNYSLDEVQKALNHKYISTTLEYLDIDTKALLEFVKRPEFTELVERVKSGENIKNLLNDKPDSPELAEAKKKARTSTTP